MKFGFTYMSENAKDELSRLDIPVSEEGGQITFSLLLYKDTIGTKVWKHPDTHVYYYLIRGVIFKMIEDLESTYSSVTKNTTTTSSSILIVASDQDEYRSTLEGCPPVVGRPI